MRQRFLLLLSLGFAMALPAVEPALRTLIAEAGRALSHAPESVMDKKMTPPSGDKHDYMSVSPYWWPDPAKPDGLPYIRRDGEVNPARNSNDTDRAALQRMFSAVNTLALAFRETGREEYARHATRLLRAWFLDPATRMNPNLDHGQAVAGRSSGRGAGIIDVRESVELMRSLRWLERSEAWTAADRSAMKAWLVRFLDWLQTSELGREEAKAENNHGTWYDVDVAALALHTGKTDVARRVLEQAGTRRIAVQIEPDGRMPRELARTKTFSYSAMNLRAFFELAEMAGQIGIDLWRFQTKDGRSIRKALDYLAPYIDPALQWPGPQIDGGVSLSYRLELAALLRRAAIAYREPRYEALIRKLPREEVTAGRWQILWPERR